MLRPTESKTSIRTQPVNAFLFRQIGLEAKIDAEKEVLSLSSNEILKKGSKNILVINFRGVINDKMAGFYRSTYKIGEETKYLGATQFEATDARQAFPCWDEPAVKATFKISIAASKGMTALSNMNVEKMEEKNDMVIHHFANSQIMSTYLVAWVIGELEHIEKVNKHGVTVRVYTTKGEVEHGRFALAVASDTLDFFSEYFDIAYPLPKMDMVAIPDFSAGAMENWGLVTYRTAYLLFDEKNTSLKAKQQIAYVVGHELAHQWFGNLVTMEWWTDLWLNEGFATWVGWLAADHLFPEWDIWTEFVVDDSQAGLMLDGLRSSHPIEVPVKNPNEIGQIFDSISYSKGASVIRMLVSYLGAETFQKGLREYLKEFKYRNASTRDLWNSLSKASGQSVNDIMNAWTHKIGYPVVDVLPSCCENKIRLKLAQSRFLISGDVKAEEDETVWNIPLRIGTDQEHLLASKDARGLLSQKVSTVDIPADVSFFKLNIDQTGFYRVNYPSEWLEKLGKAVASSQLGASDRIGVVSDSFYMTYADKLDLASVMDMLKHFKGESDYFVWSEISHQLIDVISTWWEQNEDIPALKGYVAELFIGQVQKLGFEIPEHESDKMRLLRPLVIGITAACGVESVINEAQQRFATGNYHPDLRKEIYKIIVREGGEEGFNKIFAIYKEATNVDQKLAALAALAKSKDSNIVEKALELAKDENVVRRQDTIYLTRAAGQNPYGRRVAWEFFSKNYDLFFGRYGQGGGISLFARLVSTTTENFTSEEDAQKVESFFAGKNKASFDRALQQSLERIRLRAKWLNNNREAVSRFLHNSARAAAQAAKQI